MKLYGSLRELVAAVFRKDTREITLEPNAGTYSGAVNIKLPPVLTGSDVLVSEAGSQSLINKTIDADLNTVSNIDDGNIKSGAGIDASKIGAGSVDNTEFGYLNGVTSSIQTQLGGKAASGANSDITSLSGLTTALSTSQGGTGVNSTATFPSSGVVVTEAGSATLTNKTIDGDNNTVQDLGLSSLKTVLADANKAILRDAAGAVTSALIANANISPTAAIDASKIGAGSVDNTEFGYLNGVTSSIQTQLGSKAASGANSDITSLSGLTTALSISQGGTGQTSASDAINALLPAQGSSTGKYLKTDGTNVSWASASGGAGEINAVLNSSGADGLTGWVEDAPHSISVSTATTIPLYPALTTAFNMSSSASIAIAAQNKDSGIYYEFTMPPALRNRKLKLEFYFNSPASADGTWGVAVYNGSTKVRLSTDTGATPDTVLPAGVTGGKFTAYLDTDAGTTYRVNLVQRTRTITNNLVVTNVIVGPGIQPQGAVVQPEVSYVPTTTGFGTIASATVFYKRVGASIIVQGRFTCGTTAASLASVSLPSGLSIDTSLITQNIIVGKWWLNSSTTSTPKTGALSTDRTVNTTLVRFNTHEYATTTPPSTNLNGSQIASTGEVIWFEFQVPVAEWAGSGTVQLAQNDVEFASVGGTWDANSSTTVYGPGGVQMGGALSTSRNKVVTFQTPIQATDKIDLEISPDGKAWTPMLGAVTSTGRAVSIMYNNAGAIVGVAMQKTAENQVTVYFGQFSAVENDDGTGYNWGTDYWRVRKSSAGAAVGFGIVSPGTSAGLVSAAGLPGNTTGNAIASGYVGETKITTSASRTTLPTSTGSFGAITLSAGLWDVSLTFAVQGNSMTNASNVQVVSYLGGSTTTTTWNIEALSALYFYAIFNVSNNTQLTSSLTCRVLSDGTNLYLIGNNGTVAATSANTQVIQGNFNNAYTSGAANPTYSYSIKATRIA